MVFYSAQTLHMRAKSCRRDLCDSVVLVSGLSRCRVAVECVLQICPAPLKVRVLPVHSLPVPRPRNQMSWMISWLDLRHSSVNESVLSALV